MRHLVIAATALATSFVHAPLIHADQNLLEPYFGYSTGVLYSDGSRPVDSGIVGNATWGWPLTNRVALELSVGGVLFEMEDSSAEKASAYNAKTNLILTFSDEAFTSNSVTPFLSLSAGAQHEESGAKNGTVARLGAGAGLLLPLFGDHSRLRLQADYIYLPESEVYSPANEASSEDLTDFVLSIGVQFDLGDRVNTRDCSQCDTDSDGVADAADYCPGTIFNAPVDDRGCVGDADNDGVNDVDDRCFATAIGVLVDIWGCPPDGDRDGVPDQFDQCRNSAPNLAVNLQGCFVDADGDGVADVSDDCAQTAQGSIVDGRGCELDSDSDGIVDRFDQCPVSPAGVAVGPTGCQLDSDGDGVVDSLDQCPDAAAAVIDSLGCPIIEPIPAPLVPVSNYIPEPPAALNLMEATDPSPSLTETPEPVFIDKTIQFQPSSAALLPSAKPALDRIASEMAANNKLEYEIRGHTDGQGSAEFNQKLSDARAHAVRDYLKDKGISGWRVFAVGVGARQPLAGNDTKEGRAENRRVEFRLRTGK